MDNAYIMGWVKDLLFVVGYTLVLATVLLLGGAALYGLEGADSRASYRELVQAYRESNLSDSTWEFLADTGLCGIPDEDPHREDEWSFRGSLFFALTIITTIGYGHIAPVTVGGRLFTIFYGFVGIAIGAHTLEALSNAVWSLVLRCGTTVVNKVRGVEGGDGDSDDDEFDLFEETPGARTRSLFDRVDINNDGYVCATELKPLLEEIAGRAVDPLEIEYVMFEADKTKEGTLTCEEMVDAVAIYYRMQAVIPSSEPAGAIVRIAVGCFVWCFVAGAIIADIEGWTWFEGLWFAYITLTTIGLGDFYPETSGGRWATFFMVIPGLGMVASLLGHCFAYVRYRKYWFFQRAHANRHFSTRVLIAQGYVPLRRHGGRGRRSARPTPAVQHLPVLEMQQPAGAALDDGLRCITEGHPPAKDTAAHPQPARAGF